MRRDAEPRRVALVADALGGMHGVTHTLDELRERGVPGYDVEVIGTDANVDRRLGAVAEVDIPFYPGLRVGVPSLPAVVEALAEGRYDLVHLCSPGPAGIGAAAGGADHGPADARQLPHRARRLRGRCARATRRSRSACTTRSAAFYGACDAVLSPAARADVSLRELGHPARADRALGARRRPLALRPRSARRSGCPAEINVLYAGRQTQGEGRRPAGRRVPSGPARAARGSTSCSPAAAPRRARCASASATHATFLGWLEATSWPAPTRAPTCSSSPAAPTPSAR